MTNCKILSDVKTILEKATSGITTIRDNWVDEESFFRCYWACCDALKLLEDCDT